MHAHTGVEHQEHHVRTCGWDCRRSPPQGSRCRRHSWRGRLSDRPAARGSRPTLCEGKQSVSLYHNLPVVDRPSFCTCSKQQLQPLQSSFGTCNSSSSKNNCTSTVRSSETATCYRCCLQWQRCLSCPDCMALHPTASGGPTAVIGGRKATTTCMPASRPAAKDTT